MCISLSALYETGTKHFSEKQSELSECAFWTKFLSVIDVQMERYLPDEASSSVLRLVETHLPR
jgi:hypothetical protein